MSLLLWLFVAHFIADFPLQTNRVYRLKCKSFAGGLVHGGAVLLALFVILIPYLHHTEAWFALITIAGGHFIQDTAQEPWNPNSDRSFVGYIFDQVGHLWWSFLVWMIYLLPLEGASSWSSDFYVGVGFPALLLGTVLSTYVWEATAYLWTREKNQIFKRNYHHMFQRGVLFVLLFFLAQIFI